MFWIVTGVMLAIAVLFVAVPLYRRERRLSATLVASIVIVAAMTTAMYGHIGSPSAPSGGGAANTGSMPDIEEMVAGLAQRLQDEPGDLAGWKMLGRSYLQLQNYAGAAAAFERAVELEAGRDGQTLADLGEAVLMQDNRSLLGRAGELFESALAIAPGNQKALFYSGMAALQRGNNALAADRWEALLATSPPDNIRTILEARVAELRGETAPAPQPPAPAPAPAAGANPVIRAEVSLGPAALAANLPDSTVFIFARDPDQPAPPVAAVRRRLSELPAAVTIGDGDAMIPGRVPSGFGRLEIVARVSLSGQPTAQPGDWFGQQVVDTTAAEVVRIVIDRQSP